MRTFDALSVERASLESEIQQHQEDVARHEALLREPATEHSGERGSIETELNISQGRISSLQHRIEMIDRDIDWHQRKQNTPSLMADYHEHLRSWAADKSELLEKRKALTTRLEELKTQTGKQTSEARAAEEEAARNYAQAVAWGDVDAEKTASAAAQKAAKALETAQEHERRQGLIVTALEREIQVVDEHIEEADREYSKLERNAVVLVTERLEEEWDVAAQALIDLGGKLYAGMRYLGREQMAFHDLRIPSRMDLYRQWNQSSLMVGARQFRPQEIIGLDNDAESQPEATAEVHD